MQLNRKIFLATGLACFAFVGAALYLQHVKNMSPCPLCVIQRYAFLGAGIFALVAAFAGKARLWGALALAATVGGVATVAEHLWVLAHPGLSCGIDPMETFLNKIPTATALPWLFEAYGLCGDAGDLVLGLSVPQWSAAAFALVLIALVAALFRKN
jgi:protein dithiol:quinone oxidoreductase